MKGPASYRGGSTDHHKDGCFHHLSKSLILRKGSFRNEYNLFIFGNDLYVTEIMIEYKRSGSFYLIAYTTDTTTIIFSTKFYRYYR